MIELQNISKSYKTRDGWNTVLDNVSIRFPTGCNIVVLRLNGAGKSVLTQHYRKFRATR